ncbi:Asp23/Gls24 family envelope stress response protein [Lipingzhangella sp. LS1_29]|uniref:Asp23/Gls24 family envelope stress response protein n=1 Tax=Lipingzhangella rawalii TaxID=2055835 RepID=A0ABU2H9G3_9ACTN|nr:Asp23/Gls24 family envelope stress response protein [Lipingzhangella rawalii]MDS1271961.1 Asp23/Gls24 family envelope stress response protein [Lipingzhangella rawalii]
MTETKTAAKVPSARDTASGSGTGEGKELVTSTGRTSIADHVVAKIAGMTAREVGGVFRMGGGTARAFGAVRERIPGATSNVAQGVTVEVGERQAAVDIEVVVEYGVSIPDLAAAVRRNVITGVERMTGLEVTEVNITVGDIHLPDEDGESSAPASESRVE